MAILKPALTETSRYLPGRWPLISGPQTLLLADMGSEPELMDELWSLADSQAPIASVLAAISAAGPERIPSFALIHLEPGAEKAVLRGTATMRLETDGGGPVELSCPSGVTTWVEHPASERVTSVLLSTGDDTLASTWLPLRRGVVLAGAAELGIVRALGESAPPTQPAVEPSSADVPAAGAGAGASAVSSQYDFLFGETQMRPAEPAPQLDPEPEPATQDDDAPAAPDPYGTLMGPLDEDQGAAVRAAETIETGAVDDVPLIASVPGINSAAPDPALRYEPDAPALPAAHEQLDDRTRSLAQLAAEAGRPAGPTVHAVRCPADHLNPPHTSSCRVCGDEIGTAAPVTVPRPLLGRLRLSTGVEVPLDRGALFGRKPETDALGNDRPHIMRLDSPNKDISRNHLEVGIEGWHVLVTDLNSTNGTVITTPGEPPQRLRPGESVQIPPGTIVNIADEVTFVYEPQ